nr:MAG TPA: Repressor protein CI [Caudoviricetes sp.]
MANFGSILRNLRISRDITQSDLAAKLGVSRSTVGMYETGAREPDFEAMEAIADIFNVDMDYLMGRSQVERKHPITPPESEIPPGFQPMPDMDMVPLVGRIACGTPITAEENVERMVCVPSKWHSTFTLTCEGSSMEPRIHDGDLVAIRSQPTVENGEVAAVRIGEEATLKHVYLHENFIELRPENPAFESIILSKEDMNTVVIEGKAVGLCRDI